MRKGWDGVDEGRVVVVVGRAARAAAGEERHPHTAGARAHEASPPPPPRLPPRSIEYNISYVYHAMYTYFARDNVGLTNIAEFFKKESAEERHHAELLMEYQIKRGGAVKLETILPPHTEFDHAEKGDALYAFELALSLEKLNFQKLRQLHEVAEKHGDSQMCDFVEGTLLADQMESVYEVAEKVAQLRRVGKGLGVYVFDQELGA